MRQERVQRIRRAAEDVLWRSPDGRGSESKLWVNVGKGLCAFLIVWHTTAIIDHSDTLLILLGFLIVPDIIKKVLSMRFAVASTETLTASTKSTTTTKKETK
jgi:hypothetical protein